MAHKAKEKQRERAIWSVLIFMSSLNWIVKGFSGLQLSQFGTPSAHAAQTFRIDVIIHYQLHAKLA